jgi:hypothetical protein
MTTSLVEYAIRILTDEQNCGREYTVRVATKLCTVDGTVEGFSRDADVLWLRTANGNDLITPGSAVEMIEIQWKDGEPSKHPTGEVDEDD